MAGVRIEMQEAYLSRHVCGSAWLAPTFVWSIWGLMLLAGLAVLGKYGDPFPYGEDWSYYVGPLTGAEKISARWLWSQEGEHRFPLSKLIIMSCLKLAGGDFRAPVLFVFLALAGLSFAMVRAANSLRGWTSFADAFFPLILLHWGMSPYLYAHENLYILPMLVVSSLLLIMVQKGTELTLGSAVLAGTCVVLLPLCSAPGLIYMPALTAWLAYCGVLCWRAPGAHSKYNSLLILASVLSALVLVRRYFIGYETTFSGPPVSNWDAVKFGLAFLTASFGRDTSWMWPYSGFVMLALIIVSAGALVATWRKQLDRSRALGLLFFIAAAVIAALAMGWGRGGWGIAIYFYDFLSVPMLCCIFFVWIVYKREAIGYIAQIILFALAVFAFSVSVRDDVEEVWKRYCRAMAIEQDLRERVPPYMLHVRHGLSHTKELYMLRRAGIGSFRYMPDDPPFQELSLPLVPLAVSNTTWDGKVAHGTGAQSCLTFALPQPLYVVGIRMRANSSTNGNAIFEFLWRKSGAADFPEKAPYSSPWLFETLYIGDAIDQIRIYPDRRRPCDLHVAEIVLLLPAKGQSGSN